MLADDLVRIDIDDFDHKTGELTEPVRGDVRSNAILQYLNDNDFHYVGIKTEHGKHIIMRRPEAPVPIPRNRNNCYCGLAIRIEAHVTNAYEPLRVNDVDRQYFKGDLLSDDPIDVLPPALIPIPKGRNDDFKLIFETGDRNNHFSEYAFKLGNKGFPVDDIKEIITAVNKYVLDDPLSDREIETILRAETLDKIKESQDQKKKSVVTPENFKMFLNSLGMSIKYNKLINKIEYENIPDKPKYKNMDDIQNAMRTRLKFEFQRFTGRKSIAQNVIDDLIFLEADMHAYNPVKDYLTSVTWDKKDRFPMLFDILGVTDNLYQSFIKKWFYQTAAMPFNSLDEPFQAEGVLILKGREGIGKTRFFQQLAVNPNWFSSLDKSLNTNNKDIQLDVLGVWINEIGEIDRTFRDNKSDIKSFITKRESRIRKPYGKEPVTKPRVTSFCGTTNKDVILTTETGSRRWWIVPINQKIDVSDFIQKENLRQFWAQCYHAFKCDPNCFRLSDDEMDRLIDQNKSSMELLPSENELRDAFNFETDVKYWQWMTATEIKNNYHYHADQYTVQQISRALSNIRQDDERIKQKRKKSGRFWFIPPAY